MKRLMTEEGGQGFEGEPKREKWQDQLDEIHAMAERVLAKENRPGVLPEAMPESGVKPEYEQQRAELNKMLTELNELHQGVEQLANEQPTDAAAMAETEIRDEWDTFRQEWFAHEIVWAKAGPEAAKTDELIGAMKHAYVVLLKLKERLTQEKK